MEDEQKLRVEQDRGHRAQRILEDEIFTDALAAVKENAHNLFKAADPQDLEALQTARITLSCMESVEKQIIRHIKTGKMAKKTLERLRELKDRVTKRRAA